jgi:PhzF family phenazine biosynthesis protein
MRIRIVDAFTDRPFAGNPAAVVLLPEGPWPNEEWMQRVAAELNLSETAFARPLSGEEQPNSWGLRWFTPAVEVDLCGHATLATSHLLYETGTASGTLRFHSRSGVLTATPDETGAITLDFPVNRPSPVPVPDGLAAVLGADLLAAFETGDLGDLLVELRDEAAVRDLTPDHTSLTKLHGLRGVIVTAAAASPGDDPGYNFVSRWFGVGVDVGEDPVTGSAHTALAPLWAERLGRTELVGRQLSPRGGDVRTRLLGDRVQLTGRAVTVLDGTLTTAAG